MNQSQLMDGHLMYMKLDRQKGGAFCVLHSVYADVLAGVRTYYFMLKSFYVAINQNDQRIIYDNNKKNIASHCNKNTNTRAASAPIQHKCRIKLTGPASVLPID